MANQNNISAGYGRAALLRRLLADQQVSPTGLAFVPMLIETAIFGLNRAGGSKRAATGLPAP
jgi:hypothetical protein